MSDIKAPAVSPNTQRMALRLTANVDSPHRFDLCDDSEVAERDFYCFCRSKYYLVK